VDTQHQRYREILTAAAERRVPVAHHAVAGSSITTGGFR
jgi:hypothetical protein